MRFVTCRRRNRNLVQHHWIRRSVWLAATLAAVGSVVGADAAVLCARKSASTGLAVEGATVKVRSECRPSEVPVNPLPNLVVRAGSPFGAGGSVSTLALCDAGEVATGGGATVVGNDGGIGALRSSRPQPEAEGSVPTSWRINAFNSAPTGSITATAFVVCASP